MPGGRLEQERDFHDRQAEGRSVSFLQRPDTLLIDNETYLDHATWVRLGFSQLGEVHGRDVLDHGCGHGMAAVVLARRGARVTAFDLSGGYVAEAAARAHANGVAVHFVQANAERLPFADACFDRVWGNAILHHLDLRTAAREVHRVLRPGGFAVFCEPWGDNPLLELARRHLPYPGKQRTPDERPLRSRDVRILREVFPVVELRGVQLVAMAQRLLGRGRLVQGLERCDDWLLTRLPFLQRFCRYMVLTVRKGV